MTREELSTYIEESNQLFLQADPATQRVMIAQDLLKRIEVGQLQPHGGHLYRIRKYNGKSPATILEYPKGSIKETINCGDFECSVCAKGGLFLSYVGRINKMNWNESSNDHLHYSTPMLKLQEIFTTMQLSLIETAFEGTTYVYVGQVDEIFDNKGYPIKVYVDEVLEKQRLLAMNMFGARPSRVYDSPSTIKEDTRRLKAICENIIKNNGTFIPTPQ